MTAKKFIWLKDDGIPRRGPALKRGQEHNVADYPLANIEEWVKNGAAIFVEDEIETVPVLNPKIKTKKSTKGGE